MSGTHEPAAEYWWDFRWGDVWVAIVYHPTLSHRTRLTLIFSATLHRVVSGLSLRWNVSAKRSRFKHFGIFVQLVKRLWECCLSLQFAVSWLILTRSVCDLIAYLARSWVHQKHKGKTQIVSAAWSQPIRSKCFPQRLISASNSPKEFCCCDTENIREANWASIVCINFKNRLSTRVCYTKLKVTLAEWRQWHAVLSWTFRHKHELERLWVIF